MFFILEIRKRAKALVAIFSLCMALLFLFIRLGGPSSSYDRSLVSNAHSTTEPIDPSLDSRRLALSENLIYTANGRNIFGIQHLDQHATTKKTPSPTPQPTSTPASQVLSQLAVSSLKFYGFAKRRDQAKQVFLADGTDIFVGREGEVVDRHYKIIHVADHSIELEDLLSNERLVLKLQS